MAKLSAKRPTKKKTVKSLNDLKKEVQGEKKKRINVDVSENFHLEAFIYAKKNGMNLKELVIKSLNEYMSKNS